MPKRIAPPKTSSLTLPPYIEEKINSLMLSDNLREAVLALREAILNMLIRLPHTNAETY